MSNIQEYKADFESLVKLGQEILDDLIYRSREGINDQGSQGKRLEHYYQRWYTESSYVIRQLLPDRQSEFEQLYKGEGKRERVHATNFNIQDWLNGRRANSGQGTRRLFIAMASRFQNQLNVLKSAETRYISHLFDIKRLVQADLFDSELDAARELASRGFMRAAGAVTGVVLEKHLRQVAENHNIKTRSGKATISYYNDLLKDHGILDVPSWRQVQWLGDIRNLCDHDKEKEPTREDVNDLIKGVEKLTKTLF